MRKLKLKIIQHLGQVITGLLVGGIVHAFWVIWVTVPSVEANVEKQGKGIEKANLVLCEMAINTYKDNKKILEACK